jgi:hypothetical protein
LRTVVLPQDLHRSLELLVDGDLGEAGDGRSRNAERHGAESWNDAAEGRQTITRRWQNERVVEPGAVVAGHKGIANHDIVAAGAAQAADSPRIDDLAGGGGQHHEASFGRSRCRQARLVVFVHDAQQHHPARELATADQRPSAGDAIAARDDLGPSGGPCAVGSDDIGFAVNGARCVGGELGRDPVGVAVPHTPRHRGVGARQLFENLQALCRSEVEAAIGLGQEDAEEPGVCQLACNLFRQATRRLDAVALGKNARPERASEPKKRNLTVPVSH